MVRLGVISDTHGRVPAAVHDVFAGVDHIIHAGDAGSIEVIEELGLIAPVIGVCGNIDPPAVCAALPTELTVEFERTLVYVRHEMRASRDLPRGVSLAIGGHTHVAELRVVRSVTWLNPGSPVRSRRGPKGVALVEIERDREPVARLIPL